MSNQKKKIKLAYNVPLSIFKENEIFVAYSPVLDISTAGKTYKQAHKRFQETVTIFLKSLYRKALWMMCSQSLGGEKLRMSGRHHFVLFVGC